MQTLTPHQTLEMIDLTRIFIVPRPHVDADSSFVDDCNLATVFMRKILEDNPEISIMDAFEILKQRISPICKLDWDSMMPNPF